MQASNWKCPAADARRQRLDISMFRHRIPLTSQPSPRPGAAHAAPGQHEERAMFDTYIGARDGAYRLRDGALQPLGLEVQRLWAIHAWEASGDTSVLAGSYGDGMFRSADGGHSWQPANEGLTASAFRTIAPDPLNAGAILCGAEPGRAYRSTD